MTHKYQLSKKLSIVKKVGHGCYVCRRPRVRRMLDEKSVSMLVGRVCGLEIPRVFGLMFLGMLGEQLLFLFQVSEVLQLIMNRINSVSTLLLLTTQLSCSEFDT